MAKQTINIGAEPNDDQGTPLRDAFDITNQNFTELYDSIEPAVMSAGSGTLSIKGSGENNTASGACSFIGGGTNNFAIGDSTFIGGGGGATGNHAFRCFAAVGGGSSNYSLACWSNISGGLGNNIGSNHRYGVIGGGCGNGMFSGYCSVIGGGDRNANDGINGFLGGGNNNTIQGGSGNFIGAGQCNTVGAFYSSILGGECNTAYNSNAHVIGSNLCSTADNYTFVNNLCNVGGGTSDARLKENIQPLTFGLQELSQLEPVEYNFIDDESKRTKYGFLAQNVQSVMPSIITHHPTDLVDGEPVLQFDKDAVWSSMVNAIKELQERVVELENK